MYGGVWRNSIGYICPYFIACTDNLPESVVELKQDLEKANQDIARKQQNVEKLKQEQAKEENTQERYVTYRLS